MMTDENSKQNRFKAHVANDALKRIATMDMVRSKYIFSGRDQNLRDGFDYVSERTILSGTPSQISDGTRRPEARALVLIGESGSGKTTAVERMFSKHPALTDYGQPGCPVVSIRVPAPCTLKQLGRVLLAALGYPLAIDRKEHETWEIVRRKIGDYDIKILHFDEVQNITEAANEPEAMRLRDTLKSFLNDGRQPVGLILSGLPSVREFLEQDTQLSRRMRFIKFDRITKANAAAIRTTIGKLVETAGVATNICGDVVARLIHAARGAMGVIIEMTCDAIEEALKSGAIAVTIEHFAAQYARRTGCGPSANIFLVHNWYDIDPNRVLIQTPQEYLVKKAENEIEAAAKAKKSRKGRK